MQSFVHGFWSLAFALLLTASHVAVGDEIGPPPEAVDVPPPPAISFDEDANEEGLEPEVTIVQQRDGVHEEYRLNGRLYMVKVIPAVGPAYFFVDRDGDGIMESRMNDRDEKIRVPQWVIFSW
ncbi:MAG: DUF2782 domain-containing protein [Gammaproteobacteria bacterium]